MNDRGVRYPAEIEYACTAQGRIVAVLANTGDPLSMTVTAAPVGMDGPAVVAALNRGQVELNGDGTHCMTTQGRISLERAYPLPHVDVDAPWITRTVLGHGDDGILLELDGGPGLFRLTGDYILPESEVRAAYATAFPPGTPMRHRLCREGRIAEAVHPHPSIDIVSLACLIHRGIHERALAMLLNDLTPDVLVIGTWRRDVVVKIGKLKVYEGEAKATQEDGVRLKCHNGVLSCALAEGRILVNGREIIVMESTLPETALAALVGRPLSALLAMPFKVPDATIAWVRNVGTETYVGLDAAMHKIPKSIKSTEAHDLPSS